MIFAGTQYRMEWTNSKKIGIHLTNDFKSVEITFNEQMHASLHVEQ